MNCSAALNWKRMNAIADGVGTPFFLYDPDAVQAAYARISAGLVGWESGGRIAYSLKTNPYGPLLRDLRSAGAWIEVVSAWEYDLAIRAGFTPAQIIFNGPLKLSDGIERSILDGVALINVDDLSELDEVERTAQRLNKRTRIGIRISPRPDVRPASRFGLQIGSSCLDTAMRKALHSPHVEMRCMHFHLGTQVAIHDWSKMVSAAARLWEQYSLGPDVSLDVGGGLPYEHDRPLATQSIPPRDFLGQLRDLWPTVLRRPSLIIEPGRSIAAPAARLVMRVLSRKQRTGEPCIIVVDSGTNHNVMGAFYEHLWEFEDTEPEPSSYRICGPLCMEDDVMSGARRSPMPKLGTLAVMHNAGAYSMALARTFIQPRPPIIHLDATGQGYEVVVRRERPEDAYTAQLFAGPSKAVLPKDA